MPIRPLTIAGMLRGMSPVSVSRSVDFPEPEAPRRSTRSPERISISTGPTALRSANGYRTSTPCHSAAGKPSRVCGSAVTIDRQAGQGPCFVERLHDDMPEQAAQQRAAEAAQNEHGNQNSGLKRTVVETNPRVREGEDCGADTGGHQDG